MNTFRDDYRFDDFFFFKDQLEKQLRISLSNDDLNNIPVNDNSNLLHAELEPYKSRITINSWEAASLIANNHPDADWNDSMAQGFKNSILNAVKNGIFSSTDCDYDINGELCYAEIYTKEVALWAKKHNYNWPLPIDNEIEESTQSNNELLNRIKQLEQELAEQKKINSESIYIPPLNIADTDNLGNENNQLKIDNQNLTEQLNQAKKEIEELTKFIESNNIVELTEEYLKLRERNNYHSLIGGLLFLLLKDPDRNLNQNTVIVSLQEKFKGEPFSDRSLQDKFANAKRQLLSNHPNIKFD